MEGGDQAPEGAPQGNPPEVGSIDELFETTEQKIEGVINIFSQMQASLVASVMGTQLTGLEAVRIEISNLNVAMLGDRPLLPRYPDLANYVGRTRNQARTNRLERLIQRVGEVEEKVVSVGALMDEVSTKFDNSGQWTREQVTSNAKQLHSNLRMHMKARKWDQVIPPIQEQMEYREATRSSPLAIVQNAKAKSEWEERAKKNVKAAISKAKNSSEIRDSVKDLLQDNLGAVVDYFKHVKLPDKPEATEEEKLQLALLRVVRTSVLHMDTTELDEEAKEAIRSIQSTRRATLMHGSEAKEEPTSYEAENNISLPKRWLRWFEAGTRTEASLLALVTKTAGLIAVAGTGVNQRMSYNEIQDVWTSEALRIDSYLTKIARHPLCKEIEGIHNQAMERKDGATKSAEERVFNLVYMTQYVCDKYLNAAVARGVQFECTAAIRSIIDGLDTRTRPEHYKPYIEAFGRGSAYSKARLNMEVYRNGVFQAIIGPAIWACMANAIQGRDQIIHSEKRVNYLGPGHESDGFEEEQDEGEDGAAHAFGECVNVIQHLHLGGGVSSAEGIVEHILDTGCPSTADALYSRIMQISSHARQRGELQCFHEKCKGDQLNGKHLLNECPNFKKDIESALSQLQGIIGEYQGQAQQAAKTVLRNAFQGERPVRFQRSRGNRGGGNFGYSNRERGPNQRRGGDNLVRSSHF
jgi:hypothetical protein